MSDDGDDDGDGSCCRLVRCWRQLLINEHKRGLI